jgi:uncharacterized protein (TIGR03084 family)
MVDASQFRSLLDDLDQESVELFALLDGIDDASWARMSASPGWTVKDQVIHLAALDELATLSMSDPVAFEAVARTLGDREHPNDDLVALHRSRSAQEVLAWFRQSRSNLLDAASRITPDDRLPWFGPSMSATSSMTARLMETWAHGLDVADALGITPVPGDRLRHIAHLGVSTIGWSFALRGEDPPTGPWRIELESPSGEIWAWGPDNSPTSITGPALDFCLLVTQRRNRADLRLTATGAGDHYLDIAQAFAGEPGAGRAPKP